MKKTKFVKFILAYPERIVFFICLIILISVFSFFYLNEKEDLVIEVVKKKITTLNKALDNNPLYSSETLGYLKEIKNTWGDVLAGVEGKLWLMYRKPVYAVRFERDNTGNNQQKINLSPLIKVLHDTKDPDKSIIEWSKNNNSTVEINSFRIYRRSQEEESFKLIKEILIPELTFVDNEHIYTDETLQPETEYYYYITAFSEDKNTDRKESEPSKIFKMETPRDYEIGFISVESDRVWTKIIKYINVQWQSKFYFISKGEGIGEDSFYTGCTLKDIQEIEVMHPVLKYPMKTYKIIFIDKNNVEYNYVIKPK